ncbi:cytochrome c oxidase subunit 7A, mitochondrial [Harmonia axyridis]|uniref:cytochrome c oxidase subunit 7A, mitochondrial n=1 Tax=Harmonia axyridis TaxID=115357 RepID=UPI001E278C00|nr:cytochrome c oxidase subunit 7A, mitochondrial [Harmonia axyridis]
MNLLKRSVLIPNLLRKNIFTGSYLRAIKNPCPPSPTSEDFQKLIVRKQFKRLKDNQKKFQVDDGLPVWLKGGLRDKILFQITLIGLLVCLVMTGDVFYQLFLR